MALFLKILLTEFIAEMGDKTQLMLVALTSRYKIRDIVIGTAAAVLVLNGIAVLAGGLISELIPTWLIRLIAAAAFLFFALTSLKGNDEEEEKEEAKGKFRFAPLTIFCTFFVAELGDKTQLTAVTFGANEGLNSALIVWLACSIGLFAAIAFTCRPVICPENGAASIVSASLSSFPIPSSIVLRLHMYVNR